MLSEDKIFAFLDSCVKTAVQHFSLKILYFPTPCHNIYNKYFGPNTAAHKATLLCDNTVGSQDLAKQL